MHSITRFGLLAWALLALLPVSCSQNKRPVVIFHAASLSRALGEIERAFEAAHPELDLQLEPSGSQVAARKVAELKRPADLVLVADWRIIDEILRPEYADFNLGFLTNELVLAYGEHSPHTADINQDNWPVLLADPRVRLGRAGEHTSPLGFQTLMLWQLCELKRGAAAVGGADLAGRLAARCPPEHVVPDIAELVSLLESRVIDYAFVFRSMAEEHRLKVLRLDPAVNLSDPKRAADYARARVQVRLRSSADPKRIFGAPIIYGLTLPKSAPHRADALIVARYILGPEARAVFARSGYAPIEPLPVGTPPALLSAGGS